MQTRREFFIAIGGAGASMMFANAAHAMTMNMQVTETFSGPMQQDAYLPVKLNAKAGASPSMTAEKRDDLEHEIKCQCGCPLDVYTCRTTDFSCSVSPAMHADVLGLVTGG